jgi:2-iminobutanoate/2-iminopropanoate deaminase
MKRRRHKVVAKKFVSEGAVGVGYYSPAVLAGGVCYLGGHLGVDEHDRLVGDVKAQTRQALDNLQATLHRAGLALTNVVRIGVWVRDYADMPAVNTVYAEYFPSQPPARTAFQTPALPLEAAVEFEGIAVGDPPGQQS